MTSPVTPRAPSRYSTASATSSGVGARRSGRCLAQRARSAASPSLGGRMGPGATPLTRIWGAAPQMRVSGVAPGPLLPPKDGDAADLARWAKHLPLLRAPTPDDVADAVLYLLGARGVTGDVISVDGGRHLGRAVYG